MTRDGASLLFVSGLLAAIAHSVTRKVANLPGMGSAGWSGTSGTSHVGAGNSLCQIFRVSILVLGGVYLSRLLLCSLGELG